MNALEFCTRYATERKGTGCVKWDGLNARFGEEGLTAMWVADMEFRACEGVIEAMQKRIAHGVFGYTLTQDDYYNTFFNWQESRHGYRPKKEYIRFSVGVVSALYSFVKVFTQPNDAIIMLMPVYYPFHNAVLNNGRKLVPTELINTNGVYSIDYDQFEKNIISNDVKMFIQCSPHNPVGRVWRSEELERVLEICARHNVLVVSDEIHQDIIMGANKQIPAAIVGGGKYIDNIITVTAASKTFNLAGLPNSHIIIENEALRQRYDEYSKTVNKAEPNIMSMVATQAAYEHGEEWLEGALALVAQNYEYACRELSEHAPKIVISPMEGTYLMWLDLRAYLKPTEVKEFMQTKCRVAIDYGEWFGEKSVGFIRLNLATDPKNVELSVQNIIANL